MTWIDAAAGVFIGWALSTVLYLLHWNRYWKWKEEKRREINDVFSRRAPNLYEPPRLDDKPRF